MCVVMNTIFYAFVCRHMVYFYIRVGGFQDLALRSKLLIHPLYILLAASSYMYVRDFCAFIIFINLLTRGAFKC